MERKLREWAATVIQRFWRSKQQEIRQRQIVEKTTGKKADMTIRRVS